MGTVLLGADPPLVPGIALELPPPVADPGVLAPTVPGKVTVPFDGV